MTPFGLRMRQLRAARGVTQKQMAAALGVSAAYLSALERGKRGAPPWPFLQRVIGYFEIIWDEADQLIAIAQMSHPRVTVDTAGLTPQATRLANRLAAAIRGLDADDIAELDAALAEMEQRAKARRRS